MFLPQSLPTSEVYMIHFCISMSKCLHTLIFANNLLFSPSYHPLPPPPPMCLTSIRPTKKHSSSCCSISIGCCSAAMSRSTTAMTFGRIWTSVSSYCTASVRFKYMRKREQKNMHGLILSVCLSVCLGLLGRRGNCGFATSG